MVREGRFGRVTVGRVVVKGPSNHLQTGGQYQVSVRLALPDGREINIGRTPKQDERYADLTFAVDNAFRRARRRLQDQARLMRGQTKRHETQPMGTVVRIDASGEFGFLTAICPPFQGEVGEKVPYAAFSKPSFCIASFTFGRAATRAL